jgi:transposase
VAEVVETLRFFLREGVQWRELPACDGRASGPTLRRRLHEWRDTAVLARVHAVPLRMARFDPENRRSRVGRDRRQLRRAGQAQQRPDRGKRGTKYHIVFASDGLPLGAVTSAVNVQDTRMFPELPRLALVVGARIAPPRRCRLQQRGQPLALPARGHPTPDPENRFRAWLHGFGLDVVRSVVENANAWLLNNKRLDRRHDRSAGIIQSLLTTACIFVIANRLAHL